MVKITAILSFLLLISWRAVLTVLHDFWKKSYMFYLEKVYLLKHAEPCLMLPWTAFWNYVRDLKEAFVFEPNIIRVPFRTTFKTILKEITG